MNTYTSIVILITIWISKNCDGLNILIIFPHMGKSHQLVFEPLFKQLALRGHNLTVISRFPQEHTMSNRRDIDIGDGEKDTEFLKMGVWMGTKMSQFKFRFMVVEQSKFSCGDGLAKNNLLKFLKENNRFDLVLAEMFNTNCFMGIARLFGAPIIGLSSCHAPAWIHKFFASPQNPSYIPTHYSTFSDEMTFFERVENTLSLVWDKFLYEYLISGPSNEFSKKYLGIDVLKGRDIMYDVSLLLSNTHFTLNLPKPNVPNVIEVGGIHIEKQKKMPKNTEKYINDSSEGVVYMSMGSTLSGSSFPIAKRDAFLKAFSRIKQRVIWKWETEMENKPKNVEIFRWTPQREILCHPNVKAFISHGGLLGTIEAVHCGIPVIAIPQLADQNMNAKALEKLGTGVILLLDDITEENILEALQKVMSTKFRQNVKDLSERFRDRPMSPMDTAIYWIEYVAKYKGAPHMKTAAVSMPAFQYLLIDVIAFVTLVTISFLYCLYKFVAFLFRHSRKQTKVKKS